MSGTTETLPATTPDTTVSAGIIEVTLEPYAALQEAIELEVEQHRRAGSSSQILQHLIATIKRCIATPPTEAVLHQTTLSACSVHRLASADALLELDRIFDFGRYMDESGFVLHPTKEAANSSTSAKVAPPPRQTGVVQRLWWFLYNKHRNQLLPIYHKQVALRRIEKRAFDKAARARGAQKRATKAAEIMGHMTPEQQTRFIQKGKAESAARKAAEVQANIAAGKADPLLAEFLEWRKKPETIELYDEKGLREDVPAIRLPLQDYYHHQPEQTIIFNTSHALCDFIGAVATKATAKVVPWRVRSVNTFVDQTNPATLPYFKNVVVGGVRPVEGLRIDVSQPQEITHVAPAVDNGKTLVCLNNTIGCFHPLFPKEYRKYEGLPDVGNPKKDCHLHTFVDLNGCLREALVTAGGRTIKCLVGINGRGTVEAAMEALFPNPVAAAADDLLMAAEQARVQRAEAARVAGLEAQRAAMVAAEPK